MTKSTSKKMTSLVPGALCAVIVALCLLGSVDARAAKSGGLDGLRCVDCHPSRDEAVYKLLQERGTVHLGSESAQDFVCFSCHDGTIKDDLTKLTRRRNHPSGVHMPRKVEGELPLYGNGQIECGTCHTPHAKDSTELDRPDWLRDDSGGVSSMCRACHARESESHRSHLTAVVKDDDLKRLRGLGLKLGAGGQVGCDTCHVTHGSRYPGLLVAEYGSGDVNGLCGLCHSDSLVLGKVAKETPQPCDDCHAVHGGQVKLLADEVNTCLPCHEELNGPDHHPVFDVACRGCHSIHSAPKLAINNKTRFLKTIPAGGYLCSNCHQGVLGRHSPETLENVKITKLMERRGLGGADEARGDCSFCHEIHYAPQKGLLRLEGAISCLYCHEKPNPFGPEGKKPGAHPVSVPMASSRDNVLDTDKIATLLEVDAGISFTEERSSGPGGQEVLMCTTCHGPHGDDRAPPHCSVCHWSQTELMQGALHSCKQCHPVHGTETASVRCENCHELAGDSIHGPVAIEGELPQGLAALDSKGLLANIGRFGCPTCHDPHGTGKKLLNNEAAELICLSCHDDKRSLVGGPHDLASYSDGSGKDRCLGCHLVHKKTEDETTLGTACSVCHGDQQRSITAHTQEGTPPWKEGRNALPLFDITGHRNEYGFMTCSTCHDVHRGDVVGAFRIQSDKSEDLCFKCHANKRPLLGSSHDPIKDARIPGRSPCGFCHPAHATGEPPPIWSLPAQAGGTINDQKCSSCHGSPEFAAVAKDGPGSHPVNIDMPEQMNPLGIKTYTSSGELGGRVISCSSCHDVHGVANVAGEVRPQFLRFDPTNGDLCFRCHRDKEDIRETPHDLSSFEERPLGVCSPCHGLHGTGDEEALFILDYDTEAFQRPSGRCRSCHLNNKLPLGKPLMQYHMNDADEAFTERGTIFRQYPMVLLDKWAMRTDKEPIIPLYDREYNKGNVGWLQCPSCHDPHKWSPLGSDFTPKIMESWHGKRVPTKFTRLKKPNKVKDSVCKQCHAAETLERYWYYHRPNDVVGNSFLRQPLPVETEEELQEQDTAPKEEGPKVQAEGAESEEGAQPATNVAPTEGTEQQESEEPATDTGGEETKKVE